MTFGRLGLALESGGKMYLAGRRQILWATEASDGRGRGTSGLMLAWDAQTQLYPGFFEFLALDEGAGILYLSEQTAIVGISLCSGHVRTIKDGLDYLSGLALDFSPCPRASQNVLVLIRATLVGLHAFPPGISEMVAAYALARAGAASGIFFLEHRSGRVVPLAFF
jgi:hypothetical protein